MTDAAVQFFERLITQFSFARLFFVITVLGLALGALIGFEAYTGHFKMARLNKASELLDRLTNLSPRVANMDDRSLSDIHKSVTDSLYEFVAGHSTPFDIPSGGMKVLAAAFPWLISLFMMFGSSNRFDAFTLVFGMLILASPFVIAAYYIPTFDQSWINYLLYPWLHFGLIVAAMMALQSKKKRANRAVHTTPGSVTDRASARSAPLPSVSDL